MMRLAGVDELDWLIWRLALSPHIKDDLVTIQTRWSLSDIARGHLALDVTEVLEPEPDPPKKPPHGR